MKKIYFCIFIVFIFQNSKAQVFYDTLNIVQYNILRYGSPGISCTPLSTTQKNPYLKTFINYSLPDIFAVNEIGYANANVQSMLDSVLNNDGRNYYKAASMVDNGSRNSDDIQDLVFYNAAKLELKNQATISCSPRAFMVYTFKHKNPSITDSTYFTVILGHLKSSNSTADATNRNTCATNIMNYLNSNFNKKGNYFIMGDFNMYKKAEPAYATFTTFANEKIRFYDPLYALTTTTGIRSYYTGDNTNISSTGDWNQPIYAAYHTQAAQRRQFNCGSGGGMDDRFDYIFTNRSVLDDSASVNYIPGSYKAIGNDGLHYNDSINSGTNNSAPTEVINALYNISDHIPVALKVRVSASFAAPTTPSITFNGFNMTVGGAAINLATKFVVNSPGYQSFKIVGNAAYISKNELIPIEAGTVTITGVVEKIVGFNRAEKSIIVNIIPLPVDPNLVKGTFTTNKNNIVITTPTRTITGTYSISSPNGMTITGLSTSITGAIAQGVFIGEQTISGTNISFYLTNTSLLTSLDRSNLESKINVVLLGKCLFIENNAQQNLAAAIQDVSGKIVWSSLYSTTDTQCTLPSLPNGLYILKVQGVSGQPSLIKKLIID